MFRNLFGSRQTSSVLQALRPARGLAVFEPERGMRALREIAPMEFEITETSHGSQARPVSRIVPPAGPAETGANPAPWAR